MLESPTPNDLMAAPFVAARDVFGRGNVDGHIAVTRALIAAALAPAEPEATDAAVKLTYNLATNLWPGWEDAPELSGEHIAFGREAAALNVRLAEELHLPPQRRFNGYWASGAMALAASDTPAADRFFRHAQDMANEAAIPAMSKMVEGWLTFTRLAGADRDAESELEPIAEALNSLSDDDRFYAGQFGPTRQALLS